MVVSIFPLGYCWFLESVALPEIVVALVIGIVLQIEIGLTEQTILTLYLVSRQVDLCRNWAEPTRDGGELHPMGYYWIRDAVLCPEEVLSLLGKV